MNSKKCKALRHVAQKISVGKPNVSYITKVTGQIIVDPETTRGAYLKLKKHA